MATEKRVKVFYGNTGSIYPNLNLDLQINKWAKDNGVHEHILNTSLSTGRQYAIPGRQVTHFDVLASVVFEIPSSYNTASYPSNVLGLSVSNLDGKSAKISWASASVSGTQKKVDSYLIYLANTISPTSTTKYDLVGKVQETEFNLENLKWGQEYTVKVTTLDQLLTESGGTLLSFASIDSISPTVPSFISVKNITGKGFTVNWGQSSDDGVGVKGYYVVYKEVGTTEEKQVYVPHPQTSHTFEYLKEYTSYIVGVKSFDVIENHSATIYLTNEVKTLDITSPTSPISVSITPNSTEITISWSISDDTDGSGVSRYVIYVNSEAEAIIDHPTTSATISSLTPNTRYYISISSLDEYGNESDLVSFNTKTNP